MKAAAVLLSATVCLWLFFSFCLSLYPSKNIVSYIVCHSVAPRFVMYVCRFSAATYQNSAHITAHESMTIAHAHAFFLVDVLSHSCCVCYARSTTHKEDDTQTDLCMNCRWIRVRSCRINRSLCALLIVSVENAILISFLLIIQL